MNLPRAILWSLVLVAIGAATATAFPPLFHRRARVASGSACKPCHGENLTYCTCARSLLGGGPGNYTYFAHKHTVGSDNCGPYNPCQMTSFDLLDTNGICNANCDDDGCNGSRHSVPAKRAKPLSKHHAWHGSPELKEPQDPNKEYPIEQSKAVTIFQKPISVKFNLANPSGTGTREVTARLFALHIVPRLLKEPHCAEDVEVILGVGYETTALNVMDDLVDLTKPGQEEDVIPVPGQPGLVQIFVEPRYYQVTVTVRK